MRYVRPNPRVQRTRSSPSARSSPLTRHPLGRTNGLGRRLVQLHAFSLSLAVLTKCSSAVPPVTQPLELGAGGLASLSGDWIGSVETRQAGKCTIGYRSGVGWQSGTLKAREHVRLRIEPDGYFTAAEDPKNESDASALAWSGAIGDDLKVNASRKSQAECQGVKSEVTTRLQGRIGRSTAGPTLELAGQEETCPEMDCVFTLSYRLVKK